MVGTINNHLSHLIACMVVDTADQLAILNF